ncbi:MAG: transglutaminase domain-containing protein, partial [Bacteroidales bacterium]|nr:transglutaminase domain-containing protein [Bacteroidales bacterium]
MKRIFTIHLLVFCISLLLKSLDYDNIDKKVLNYPTTFSSIESLSKLINKDFSDSVSRVRAIYTWLAVNIHYDRDKRRNMDYGYSYYERGWNSIYKTEKEFEYESSTKILLTKKGVCGEYANLFKVLCEFCSIECVVISGTAKTAKDEIGKHPIQTDHAWNAVKIKDNWKLIDVTWTSNYYESDSTIISKPLFNLYFFSEPVKFFTKHYPKSNKWLLIDKSPKEFAELPLFHNSYYFSEIEIVGPRKGIIKLTKDRLIKIVLKNSKDSRVSFKFSFEKTSKALKPSLTNDLCIYETKLGNVIVNYLTIYI